MKIKKIILITLMATSLTGCTEKGTQMLFENNTATTSDYYSDIALSSTEYSIFLEQAASKSINDIISVSSNLKTFKSGSITEEQLVSMCKSTIKELQECYDELKHKKPATGYEDNREKAMQSLIDCVDELNYIIENNNKEEFDIEHSVNVLSAQSRILTTVTK